MLADVAARLCQCIGHAAFEAASSCQLPQHSDIGKCSVVLQLWQSHPHGFAAAARPRCRCALCASMKMAFYKPSPAQHTAYALLKSIPNTGVLKCYLTSNFVALCLMHCPFSLSAALTMTLKISLLTHGISAHWDRMDVALCEVYSQMFPLCSATARADLADNYAAGQYF